MRKIRGFRIIKSKTPVGIEADNWLDIVADVADAPTELAQQATVPPRGAIPWESRSKRDKKYIKSLRLQDDKTWEDPLLQNMI